MGYGLDGTAVQPTCFPTMMHVRANAGLRISCRAAPVMPPRFASSAPNCSRFGLIWTPATSDGGISQAFLWRRSGVGSFQFGYRGCLGLAYECQYRKAPGWDWTW